MTIRISPSAEGPDLRPRARNRYELLGSTGIGVGVTVLSATRTRWTFSRPVIRNGALSAVANYRLVPSLRIRGVTPGPGDAPIYVDVDHDEMRDGVSYTPIVDRVESA